MSGVPSVDQRMKGHGQVPNGPKDGINDHEELDSWRNHHHQVTQSVASLPHGYGAAMSTSMSDPYMSSYYGTSYPYPTFGVGDGAWSNGGDPMTYPWGVGGQIGHDSYNLDGMFGPGGFGGFGQPGFNYGFHGNGDYSAWGNSSIRRNHYEDLYRDGMYGHDDRATIKAVDQGMQGLSITDKKDQKDLMGKEGRMDGSGLGSQQKKMTWANIASQPARPQPSKTKKSGLGPSPVITGKHMDIGTWEAKNGGVKPNVIPPPPAPRPSWVAPRGRGMPVSYSNPQPQAQPVQQANLNPSQSLASHPVLDELKMKNEYNPKDFDLNPKSARYFVIKSYSEDDIHRSIKYEIWCSTEHGNKRLDTAYRERESKGPIYLFFSVNGSGHFCGMAQMVSAVDYNASSSVWAQDKWKGQFKVKWIYVKDVPNAQLRHIRLENNENKPVTNSRDTQEVPPEKGRQVLKIIHIFKHSTSIFDDFVHYEKRQEEEDARRQTNESPTSGGLPKEERGGGDSSRGRSARNRN